MKCLWRYFGVPHLQISTAVYSSLIISNDGFEQQSLNAISDLNCLYSYKIYVYIVFFRLTATRSSYRRDQELGRAPWVIAKRRWKGVATSAKVVKSRRPFSWTLLAESRVGGLQEWEKHFSNKRHQVVFKYVQVKEYLFCGCKRRSYFLFRCWI